MRFTIDQDFAAPVDAVAAAYVDPEFLGRLSRLPKLGRPTLVHRVEAGDLVHQWVKYAFTGDVNAAVRRVVDPARLTWIEESTFDRRTLTTTFKIVPDHYRHLLRSSGTLVFESTGDSRSRRRAEAELKVTVPLVGGKVEQAMLAGLREHAALEIGVVEEWLAGH
jgi:hypothetical protein